MQGEREYEFVVKGDIKGKLKIQDFSYRSDVRITFENLSKNILLLSKEEVASFFKDKIRFIVDASRDTIAARGKCFEITILKCQISKLLGCLDLENSFIVDICKEAIEAVDDKDFNVTLFIYEENSCSITKIQKRRGEGAVVTETLLGYFKNTALHIDISDEDRERTWIDIVIFIAIVTLIALDVFYWGWLWFLLLGLIKIILLTLLAVLIVCVFGVLLYGVIYGVSKLWELLLGATSQPLEEVTTQEASLLTGVYVNSYGSNGYKEQDYQNLLTAVPEWEAKGLAVN
jgi:hypothetical protein